MQIDISIVIPIFGTVHTERLFAVIDSLLLQTNVSLEIIVSEQSIKDGLPLKKRFSSIVHIVSHVDKEGEYNAGVARNIGMKHANGEYVYFNDADIIFFDPTYLHRLLQAIKPNEILIRPRMWRMVMGEVPRFLHIYESKGLKVALSSVVYKENYLVSFPDSTVQLELVEFHEKVFSATAQQLQEYKINPTLHGQENLLWQRIVHCGGIFGNKEAIESIGGYSSRYPVCVYEDSDLQWKLRSRFDIQEIHEDDLYAVMHLDHELPYRSMLQEDTNKKIFEQRKIGGADLAIKQDLLVC
jgi:glycosyltransferase involved in cell wall biosynthesis